MTRKDRIRLLKSLIPLYENEKGNMVSLYLLAIKAGYWNGKGGFRKLEKSARYLMRDLNFLTMCGKVDVLSADKELLERRILIEMDFPLDDKDSDRHVNTKALIAEKYNMDIPNGIILPCFAFLNTE